MEYLAQLNKAGKDYLVYIDAEFQTFRQSENDDKLKAAGYTKSPYNFGMAANNIGKNNYHFLLSFGYIVIERGFIDCQLALFPSLFDPTNTNGFSNSQLLEPGYTTCAPGVAAAIAEKRWKDGGLFPYYKNLDLGKRKDFVAINNIYNNSIPDYETLASCATLSHFFSNIVPNALIIHKGQNDLYALRNSAKFYNIYLTPMLTRDLDMIDIDLPGLPKRAKLGAIQTYFINPPEQKAANMLLTRLHDLKLGGLNSLLMEHVRYYFYNKWGPEGASIAAHNPLVDCVYALIMDLGLGSLADRAISWSYTD